MSEEVVTIQAAIDSFQTHLALSTAKKTRRTYGGALNRFSEYLAHAQGGPLPPATEPVSSLTVDHAIGYVHWLITEHFGGAGEVSKSTLRTYLSAITRFYAYLVREQLILMPAGDQERLKDTYREFRKGRAQRLPKVIAPPTLERLIEAARSVPPEPKNTRHELLRLRNVAILETLRCTGMRVGELIGLRRDDLGEDQTARVIGKGDKERTVYFDDTAWRAVQAYLRARRDKDLMSGQAARLLPVFARHDRAAGRHILAISTNTVRQIFKDVLELAGIDKPFTPHAMRHTFATRTLNKTGDLAIVQDLLGHASPTTTRVYAKVNPERLKQAHRQVFDYDREDEEAEDEAGPPSPPPADPHD